MSERDKPSAEKPRFSAQARLKSFVYAGRGLRWLAQDEHNAWLHLAASAAVIIAGIALKVALEDWRWIVIAVALVWVLRTSRSIVPKFWNWPESQFKF